MHRPGADPANMQVSDFICDFSGRAWDGAFPMVEGHRGSLISGECLAAAYTRVVLEGESSLEPPYSCTMCLEERSEPGWRSPTNPEAIICKRCIKQSAGRLHKDPDWEWRKPEASGGASPGDD